MNDPVLADLYLRLSDARSEEALDGRERKLRARAAELGWEVYRVVIENDLVPGNGDGRLRPASAFKRRKIRTPSGRTELRTVRPGFRSVLRDLTEGPVRGLLAEDLDRLLRQPRDGEDLLDAVELSRATCRSLSGSLTLTEGGTDTERFTARIIAAVANKSSADTARRVRDRREVLCGQSWQGGRRPYGYVHDPDAPRYHKTLIVVDDEADELRGAAAAILERGISLKAIARDLRERGVPTVSGAQWTTISLKEVLIKPAIAGLASRRDRETGRTELRPAPWPPILERDVWERLVDKLTDPARADHSRGNEPRWLVSRFARCGTCGSLTHVTGGRKGVQVYRGDDCRGPGHVVRAAVHVDRYVADVIVARLDLPDAKDLMKPPPRPGVNAGRLRAQARKLRAKKKAQMRLHAADVIDDDDLAEGMRDIRERLAKIGAQLAASDEPDPLEEFRGGQPARAVWESLSVARRREVIRVLLESVTFGPGRRGRGFDEDSVLIEWRAAARPK